MLPRKLFASLVHISKANIRQKSMKRLKRDTNPGISRRVKALNTTTEELEEVNIDDYESDLMQAHKAYDTHIQEIEIMKEKERLHMIRQKYFKNKALNFLTWHDKEQIRYLYRTNPEEWTIEKLSKGFPALPEVILKIVKSNWTKKPEKVTVHDDRVQKNWKQFKDGSLRNLPKELKEHLSQFTSRTLIFTPFKAPEGEKTVVTVSKPTVTEFSDIITNYEKLKHKDRDPENKEFDKPQRSIGYSANTKQKVNKNESCLQTLDSLKAKLDNDVTKGKKISADDKFLLKQLENNRIVPSVVELKKEELEAIAEDKYSQVIVHKENRVKDVSHLVYPEKIVIPKKQHKRGSTYRLNDCFYDDDGEFLYRVPGMIAK